MRHTICALLMLALPALADKKPIVPPDLAVNPNFSAGMLADGTLYVSGQIGQDREDQAGAGGVRGGSEDLPG